MGLKTNIEDVVVLLVDDDKLPLVIMSRALEELGIKNILKAENGQSALQILFAESVDLVISDWNMPVMSGLKLFKSIQLNDTLNSIPFLLLTSANSKEEVLKALKVGVKNYVIKSNDTVVFKEKVKSVLGL